MNEENRIQQVFSIGDVCYLVRGNIVAKCRIEEVINHYTQEKVIIKYIVHVYGIDGHVTLEPEDLFMFLNNAKTVALEYINNVQKSSIENLANATDEVFDAKEAEFLNK